MQLSPPTSLRVAVFPATSQEPLEGPRVTRWRRYRAGVSASVDRVASIGGIFAGLEWELVSAACRTVT